MKKLIGLSLFEVLISLLMLAMILLAFETFEINIENQSYHAYLFSVAESQLINFLELKDKSLLTEWEKQRLELLPNSVFQLNDSQFVLIWNGKKECQTDSLINPTCLQFKL